MLNNYRLPRAEKLSFNTGPSQALDPKKGLGLRVSSCRGLETLNPKPYQDYGPALPEQFWYRVPQMDLNRRLVMVTKASAFRYFPKPHFSFPV